MDELVSTYRWVTKEGRMLKPSEMETSHLFNSLLMIWNNTQPEEYQIKPFKKWKLSDNTDYWMLSISQLGRELLNRDDLTQEQEEKLLKIASNYKWLMK